MLLVRNEKKSEKNEKGKCILLTKRKSSVAFINTKPVGDSQSLTPATHLNKSVALNFYYTKTCREMSSYIHTNTYKKGCHWLTTHLASFIQSATSQRKRRTTLIHQVYKEARLTLTVPREQGEIGLQIAIADIHTWIFVLPVQIHSQVLSTLADVFREVTG